MSGEIRWEVTYVCVQWWKANALAEVNRLGSEGWEPFAASDSRENGITVFLRRVARAEAKEE